MDVDLQSQDGRVTKTSVVGNQFRRGPSFSRDSSPVLVHTVGQYSLVSGSRVYVYDNQADGGSSYSELVELAGGEHVPAGDDDRVLDGAERLLVAAARAQAGVLRSERHRTHLGYSGEGE